MLINELCLITISIGFLFLSFYDSYYYYLNTDYRCDVGQIICVAILTFLAFNSLIGIIMILSQINQIFVKFGSIITNLTQSEEKQIKIIKKEIVEEKKAF